jgi:hypothetical protein
VKLVATLNFGVDINGCNYRQMVTVFTQNDPASSLGLERVQIDVELGHDFQLMALFVR